MQHYQDVLQDRSGNAIAGAVITVTNHLDGLPATLYADYAGTIILTSIVTDFDGSYSFYFSSGRYDFSFYKNGLLLKTQLDVFVDQNTALQDLSTPSGASMVGFNPTGTISSTTVQTAINELDTDISSGLALKTNIADLAATTGAALVGFQQTGSTIPRTVDDQLKETVSVLDFGADPTGVVDSTTFIQAAFDYIGGLGGGEVKFPAGTYKVNQSILVWSNTTASGDGKKSRIYADQVSFQNIVTGALFRNKNWSATVFTDSNILIEKLAFDYGSVVIPGGGAHAIAMRYTTTVHVDNCYFNNGEDATAFKHCINTIVSYCYAYGFINCAFDHWDSPKDAQVFGCYAQTSGSAQMVNFNAEDSGAVTTGLVADGFIFSNNILVCTSTTGSPCQLEPLIAGNTVKNVTVSDNIFRNVHIAGRRNTQNLTINKNVFCDYPSTNTSCVITCNQQGSGFTPANITVTNNILISPYTISANNAAIRLFANNYICANNIITGGTYYIGLDTSTFIGKTSNNLIDAGTSASDVLGTKQNVQYTPVTVFSNSWVNFGSPYSNAGYLKDENGFVHLRGVVSGGTVNLKAFSLPTRHCPEATILVPVISNGVLAVCKIDTSGDGGGVTLLTGGSNVSFHLDGISFKYSS